jgi:hypothetical protein
LFASLLSVKFLRKKAKETKSEKKREPDFRPAPAVTRFIRLHRGAQKGDAANLESLFEPRHEQNPYANPKRTAKSMVKIRPLEKSQSTYLGKKSTEFVPQEILTAFATGGLCQKTRAELSFGSVGDEVQNAFTQALRSAMRPTWGRCPSRTAGKNLYANPKRTAKSCRCRPRSATIRR